MLGLYPFQVKSGSLWYIDASCFLPNFEAAVVFYLATVLFQEV